jgi:hypothetical protein
MSNYATQIVEDFQTFLEEKAGKCIFFYEHFIYLCIAVVIFLSHFKALSLYTIFL